MVTETTKSAVPAQVDPMAKWKMAVQADVKRAVGSMMTGERAKDVEGRTMIALSDALTTTPDIVQCSPNSIRRAIALMVLTDTRPGGAAPKLYLIPKKVKGAHELQAWFTHRALIEFAGRAGWIVSTSLVHKDDSLLVEDGEVRHGVTDPDNPPTKYEDLRGVVVYAWPKGDKASKVSRYVPKATIDARRASSDSARGGFSPWNNWPIEMAEKTAIKYAVARGLFPVDDSAVYDADAGEPQTGPFVETRADQEQAPAQRLAAPQTQGFDGLASVVGAGEPEPVTVELEPHGSPAQDA